MAASCGTIFVRKVSPSADEDERGRGERDPTLREGVAVAKAEDTAEAAAELLVDAPGALHPDSALMANRRGVG